MDRLTGRSLDAAAFTSSSSCLPHDNTEVEEARPSPWAGVSPSPAARPSRAAWVPHHTGPPLLGGLRSDAGAAHKRATAGAEARAPNSATAAKDTRLAPSVYARHYLPLFANETSTDRAGGGSSITAVRSRANGESGPWHTSATTTLSDDGSSQSGSHVDITQLITRRYRELTAAWEEWRGVMAAVGPQRVSDRRAHAHASQQAMATARGGAEKDLSGTVPFYRRLYQRLCRVTTAPLASSHRARQRGGRRLRWPRTRVDHEAVLHAQLLRWCRETLVPYLLDSVESLVAPVSVPLSRSLSGSGSAAWRGGENDSNVEVLFPHGGEWGDSAVSDDVVAASVPSTRFSPSSADSSSASDEADDDGHLESTSTDVGDQTNPQKSRFTLAWVRGVNGGPTTAASSASPPLPADETHFARLLRRLGLRWRRRTSIRATARKPRRYRRARDMASRPTTFTPLDLAVLAQISGLVPSLWELPPSVKGDALRGDIGVCASEAAGAHPCLFAPFAPLSDFSRGAAQSALDLSLTPTTLATTHTTTSHGTHSGGEDTTTTSRRPSAHDSPQDGDTESGRVARAEARLWQSLAALEACLSRHEAQRLWERRHAGEPITAHTRGTAAAASSPSSSHSSDACTDSQHRRTTVSAPARSGLLSVAHDAIHPLPSRSAFHHPPPAPSPYWQRDHEAHMAVCLKDAVEQTRRGDEHGETALAHTPYWRRTREPLMHNDDGARGFVAASSTTTLPSSTSVVGGPQLRAAFDHVTASFCESIAAAAVQRVLTHRRGAADRAVSQWALRHLCTVVTEELLKSKHSQRVAEMIRPAATGDGIVKGVLACIRSATPVSPATVQLSAEDTRALAQVREKANSDETAAVLHTIGYTITYSQLASLRPRTWLNDQVINNYLQLLCESATDRHHGVESVVSMGSHFYSKVHSELETLRASMDKPHPHSARAASQPAVSLPPLSATNTLLRWLRRRRHILLPYSPDPDAPNCTTVHTILVPVNLSGQHWALAVARKPRPSPTAPLSRAVDGNGAAAMSWVFYDSLCPSSGKHPRALRILHELRHVFAECTRHLVPPSLLSVGEKPTASTTTTSTAVLGTCRIALPYHPSTNFTHTLGQKRPFASLESLNKSEAAVRARVEARRRWHQSELNGSAAQAADSSEESTEARQARLRAVARQLVRATWVPLSDLLPQSGGTAASQARHNVAEDVSEHANPDTDSGSVDESDMGECAIDAEELDSDEVEWFSRGSAHVPQQQNGFDCGVFVCQVAWCVTEGVSVSFSQYEDIPRMREIMTLELLSAKVLRRLPTTHMSSSIDVSLFHR